MHFPQQLERGGCEVLTQRGRWWKGNRLHVDRRWLSSPAGYTEDSFRGREEPQPPDQMRGFQEVSEATWVQSQARGRGWPGCEGIIIGACLTERRGIARASVTVPGTRESKPSKAGVVSRGY